MWEPEIVLDVMKRVHSPDRQRTRLFAEGDDYAEKSRMVREQLDVARRASRSINVSHEYLSDELQDLKRKLSQRSTRMEGERRALVSESRGALDEFHSRLEHVRQMRTNGRDTPDTVDAIENALKEAWEDFDDVRKVMLTNLKILNDAKEELMRERLHDEEESDEEQILSLERMMYEIRDREYHKTEDAFQSIRDRRNIHGSGSGY
jgi:exonuclease VII large subunit